MKRALSAVGLLAFCLTWVPSAAAQAGDHLKCYKIKDPQPKATYTAELDGLTPEAGCVIKVPAKLACVPATKTNVTPTPPGGGGTGTPNSFFCYKLKCPTAILPTLSGVDQFGGRTVTPIAAKLLCAPLAGATTTTTTTTSTTTTTLATACSLPATGQQACYDSAGTPITCAGTGQDGELRKGPPLYFTDNGDGTILDHNTGLVWEKLSRDGSVHDVNNSYSWNDAFAVHVATLNSTSFAGHTDWRLPNVRELQSIVNYGSFGPAVSGAFFDCDVSGCDVLGCSCTASSIYWSSTTNEDATQNAWFVNFFNGYVDSSGKGAAIHVRAVRGGS